MIGLVLMSVILFNLSLITAETPACDLDATLINQDPYPAIPGDYVKLVFQLTGVESSDCGSVSFELFESYPISFDPEDSPITNIEGGTFERAYSSSLIVPYQVRVDKDALNGENQIEVKFGSTNSGLSSNQKIFYLEVDNSLADFELHIDKYSYDTKEMTIEILNIGESDVEALTLEIPKQETMDIRGTNRVVVGDLDSNEYTTADFKADMKDGEVKIKVLYTDSAGFRRDLVKTINFDSSYFAARAGDSSGISTNYLIVGVVVFGLIFWWFLGKKKKRKKEKMRSRGMAQLK